MTASPLPPLRYVTAPPRQVERGRPPLLILLHGFGSNEQDLFGLVPALDGRCLAISPRAPVVVQSDAYAWFEITFTETGIIANTAQALDSRDRLIDFIEWAVAEHAADPDRVYLLGFSQGAIMSVAAALARPRLIAGVIAMSGRVYPEMVPADADRAALAGKPFLVVHGTLDETLPITNGRASRELLEALGVDLTYREYVMGHEVSPESLADVAAWLHERLDGPADV